MGHDAAAWRADGAAAAELVTGRYLVERVQRAERAGLDFVTLGDAFGLQGGGQDAVRGRLDALLAMAVAGPQTSAIGLVPVTDTTHTEPFHLAKNIATLDYVSLGRAGWWPQVSPAQATAELFGRKPAAPLDELWAEADEVVDVVRRLWDSWEDDAVIRDVATGRYLDRDKVHYVDFEGRFFSIRGPSITPRSPQGQPLVFVEGGHPAARELAARRADVVLVAAGDAHEAKANRDELRARAAAHGRDPDELAVVVAVDVDFDEDDAPAAAALAEQLADWWRGEALDGVLVRPARLDPVLALLDEVVMPVLAGQGLHAPVPSGSSLRTRFGLDRPPSRYAAAT
jgi:alkanesulfonate monooxygenase SsuD/methylene tetrahydromethanopterin reductase-like flavin-dependent oxidoreductase (luciferase family)